MAVVEEVGRTVAGNGDLVLRGKGYGTSAFTSIYFQALVQFPARLSGWVRKDEEIQIEEVEDTIWSIEVPYSLVAREPDIGEWAFDFSYQMPGVHIFQSLSTVWSSAGAPDFEGAINVANDAGKLKVEGIALQAPPETFRVRYTRSARQFNEAYRKTIGSLVGSYNNAPFKGHAAGELLLTRVNGGITSQHRASVEFGIALIENKTNIPVGSITVPSKKGHDLLWVYYEEDTDPAAFSLIKKPTAAYVEQVYPSGNFANLGF